MMSKKIYKTHHIFYWAHIQSALAKLAGWTELPDGPKLPDGPNFCRMDRKVPKWVAGWTEVPAGWTEFAAGWTEISAGWTELCQFVGCRMDRVFIFCEILIHVSNKTRLAEWTERRMDRKRKPRVSFKIDENRCTVVQNHSKLMKIVVLSFKIVRNR